MLLPLNEKTSVSGLTKRKPLRKLVELEDEFINKVKEGPHPSWSADKAE